MPLIFTTALIFLSPVSIASYVPSAAAKLLSSVGAPLTAALPAAIAYAIFYLAIAPFGLGFSMATLVFAQLAAATHLYSTYGGLSTFMPAAIGVHVVSWIAQFYGHGVHEGRAPALLDNLFQVRFHGQTSTAAVLFDRAHTLAPAISDHLRLLTLLFCRPSSWRRSSSLSRFCSSWAC